MWTTQMGGGLPKANPPFGTALPRQKASHSPPKKTRLGKKYGRYGKYV